MAQVLRVTDGSTTVNLLNIVNLLFQGWSPAVGTSHTNLYERVTDRMAAKVKTSSIDAVAAEILKLNNLLRKAWQFHNTEWQTTPVYLESQGKNETKARFSLIFNGQLSGGFSEHDFVNETANLLRSMQLRIEREAGWRANVPGNYPSALTLTASDGPANPTSVHIANFTDETLLTHIFNFDDSLTAFGSNLIADSDGFDYFEVSGSTPATGDIVYFGSTTAAFHHVQLNISQAMGTGPTIVWEYYNGAWVTLTPGTKLGLYPIGTTIFWTNSNADALRSIHVSNVSDWIAVAINGVTANWIRSRVTAGSTGVTAVQGAEVVYAQKNNYIEIPTTTIDGDLPPFLLQAFGQPDGDLALTAPNFTTTSRIICGARSRDLDNFQANIPFADVTTDWTQTLGTDASEVADPNAPGDAHIAVSFATETLVERVRMQVAGNVQDWAGTFRLFLRCQQIGGSNGDLSVQMKFRTNQTDAEGSESATETVDLLTQDAGLELVDLGVLNIPRMGIIDSDAVGVRPIFEVWSKRNTGSSTLRIYDGILIPIDEWAATYNAPVDTTTSIGSTLGPHNVLEVDAGVVTTRIFKSYAPLGDLPLSNNAPMGGWELHGQYPLIEPSKQYRLYFIMMHYNGTFGTMPFISPLGMSLAFELRAHNRYKILRGADV